MEGGAPRRFTGDGNHSSAIKQGGLDGKHGSFNRGAIGSNTRLCADEFLLYVACAVLAGVTGGPVRGVTNHFIPVKPFSTGNKNTELFPGVWKKKVTILSCTHHILPSNYEKTVCPRRKQQLVMSAFPQGHDGRHSTPINPTHLARTWRVGLPVHA
jgi:hypothetical protein